MRLEGPSATSLTDAAACHGVRLAPGPWFGVDGTLEGRLRLPFTQPPQVLVEAVSRIAEARLRGDGPPAGPPRPGRAARRAELDRLKQRSGAGLGSLRGDAPGQRRAPAQPHGGDAQPEGEHGRGQRGRPAVQVEGVEQRP